MDKFCNKCGQKADAKTGLCPKCNQTLLTKKSKQKKSVKVIIAVFFCICIIVAGTFGISKSFNRSKISYTQNEYNAFIEGFTDIIVTDEESAVKAVGSVSKALEMNNAEEELKVNTVQSVKNDHFYRMQQYYNNIPVYGRSVVVSADKDGNVLSLTSNYKQITKNIDLSPKSAQTKISESIAKYLQTDDLSIQNISNDNLVIYNLDGKDILAYAITIDGFGTVIVDANTAEVIHCSKLFNDISAEVKSKDGTVSSIGWQNDDGSYHLYNDDHKIAIFNVKGINTTINDKGSVNTDFRNYGIDTMYSKKNNKFDKNAVILLNDIIDISNYYKNLGFVGFDQVHAAINDSYDNGNNARGGSTKSDGKNCAILLVGKNYNFANKDTTAHEYTHAVSNLNIGWSSNNIENSALNEAYSDIFGSLYENNQNPDWKITHLSKVLRDLTDPSKTNGYENMADIDDTDGHDQYTLSTIVSHSAYLMWNGINGSDDRKINATTLSELWYRSMLLLQSNADFAQCRNAVEMSARMMLKSNQLTKEQYKTVVTAFEDVGIENASFTYTETVKNKFDLSVLSRKKTENIQINLEVIKMPTIKAGPKINNNKMPKSVIKENLITGQKSLELNDGTYVLRLTDISAEQEMSKTINIKIVVAGDNENAKDKVIVNTDFTDIITVILDEDSSNKITGNNDELDSLKSSLINKYGLSSQESFISCLGKEIQKYPTTIFGIIAMVQNIDLDGDKINDLIVLHASKTENNQEAQLTIEIYNSNNNFRLTMFQTVCNISFCTANNIYLFYSDVIQKYCIVIDSYSNGSYTGVNSWSAKVLTLSNDSIDSYANWEVVPTIGVSNNFETEFKKINLPYAKYCTDWDTRNDNIYFQSLCEVEHEVYGNTNTYMTRNHRLYIKNTSDFQLNNNTNNESTNIWDSIPDKYIFTSGTGAWATKITINNDGSFVGKYHDSNIGDTGIDHPNGVQYICEFTGKFSKPQKINEYTYSMELEKLTSKEESGKIYYENGVKYICSEPYGFDNAQKFYIYLPNAPISEIEDAFLSWSHLDTSNFQILPNDFYGIYNVNGEQGFISCNDN